MTALLAASVWLLVGMITLALLWAARSLAPRVAEDRDYSVVRHLLWVVPALALAVVMFAAKSIWVFLPVAGVVTVLLFFRAALDAQDGERQRVAFLELFAGYFLVAWGLLVVRGDTAGLVASPQLAEMLRAEVAHIALPAQWLWLGPSTDLAAWAAPEHVAMRAADNLSTNLAAATATSSFLLAWFSLASLSPRLIPEPGLPLMPLPMVTSTVFFLSFVAARVAPGIAATGAAWGVALLWPAVAAEGIAIIRAAGTAFRSRRLLSVLLVLLLPLLPRLWGFLAFVGLLSSWLGLRGLVPPLRAGDGRGWHPRLSLGVRASAVVFVLAVGLGAADQLRAAAASPLVGAPPPTCGRVTMKPAGEGVAFESPWASFTIDAADGKASSSTAEQTCKARGARLCTSDEWYLACLCTYPAESRGGVQVSGNHLLAHRVRTEAEAGPDGARGDGKRFVKRLLEGPGELVVGANGEQLVAGGAGPDGSAWMTDCRYRGVVTPPGDVGVRCCVDRPAKDAPAR
jgi:hypothetical protein